MEHHSPQRVDEVQASKDPTLRAVTRFAGLCADTILHTMDGELRASDVAPGDRIITRDAGMVFLRGVRHKRVHCECVLIKSGSLGHNRPQEDMILPVGTKVLIRDWRAKALYAATQKLLPIEDLIDGEFVTLLQSAEHDIVELLFDAPHVLYAGGMEIGCQTVQ